MENIYVIRTIDFIKKHLYKINWRKLSSNPNAISILENTGNIYNSAKNILCIPVILIILYPISICK